MSDPQVELFQSIGLTQAKAKEAKKNPKSATALQDLIQKHNLTSVGLDEKQAVLVTAFAGNVSKLPEIGDDEKSFVVKYILEGKLKSVDQVAGTPDILEFSNRCSRDEVLAAASKYIESHHVPIDATDFEHYCGVGMSSSSYYIAWKDD